MISIVFVGGGHSHVLTLLRLAKLDNARLILISESAKAWYSGMIPGCISGLHAASKVVIDLRALCEKVGCEFVEARVSRIESVTRTVHLETGDEMRYDVLSINIGSATKGDGTVTGVREHAILTRPISSLLQRLETFETSFEEASGPLPLSAPPRVLVVGGGAAGAELAMAIVARHTRRWHAASVTLIASSIARLGTGSARLARSLKAALIARRVELVEARVDSVQAGRVTLSTGDEREHDCVLWAAGAAPRPLAAASDLTLSDAGFFRVHKTLLVHDQDFVFASGDCADVDDSPQIEKAGVFAVREAPVLTQNIEKAHAALRASKTPKNTQYAQYDAQSSFLRLIMTGDGSAVASKWGMAMTSSLNWKLKTKLDFDFMNLFQ